MQPLEAIIVGAIIAMATGFLLWTFWPTTGKKKGEKGDLSPCANSSCGCTGKELAARAPADRREPDSSAPTIPR